MKTVALLTGRGNNSLKDKNIIDILGKPVLYYPAHAGKLAKEVDLHYCSSDDERILSAAEAEGYKRIQRPVEFALPTSRHIESIIHGLTVITRDIGKPDILVTILANNLTIKPQWIDDCVALMKAAPSVTAVVPVYEDNDHHPLRGKRLNPDGTLSMYEQNITGKISTNRQDLPKCYFLAHNFWVLNVDFILSDKEGQPPWGFMGNKILPYEIDESIDIHKEEDLFIAKNWIEANYVY
jgi:CMP-N-acetylneuraminic acid synthetase